MITKSEWQSVSHQLKAGDPPTAEEMLAYSRGELSAEEEARVRERLVSHPDLVRTMTEPFPSEGAEPGDPDFMSDEEFATHWASLRNPIPRRGRVLHFWHYSTAIAATLAIVLTTLLWQANSRVAQPRVVWEQQVLFPDGRRGPQNEPATLTAQGESVLLVIPLIGQSHFDRYRLEILNVASNRSIWTSDALRPGADEAFAILVPRRFLGPGTYQIVVHGVSGTREERLATYSLRVPNLGVR